MWVRLLKSWCGRAVGKVLKVGYFTFQQMLDDGLAEQCEPPSGAVQPERENALLKTEREKRENV